MKYVFLSLILLFASCREIPVDKNDLLGDDFRLFQDTPAWELAKAVEDEDTDEIKRQVLSLKVPVDSKEEIFGQPLLMVAVENNLIESVRTLLELGADPNEPEDTLYNPGSNAVIVASRFDQISSQILKLLLEYGGDPNSIERGMQKDNLGNWEPARFFALSNAVFSDFEKVKILVEAGADVNLYTETIEGGALYSTLVHNRMDIMLYLLEHGADYHRKYERYDPEVPHTLYYTDLLEELRLCIYPLDSKEYKDKLKVIRFQQKKGMDYWKTPISETAIELIKQKIAPKNEKEFLEYLRRY